MLKDVQQKSKFKDSRFLMVQSSQNKLKTMHFTTINVVKCNDKTWTESK